MVEYKRIAYLENIKNNDLDEVGVQSLSACLDNENSAKIRKLEYYFCDDIKNKLNRHVIVQHGIKQSVLSSLVKRRKLNGTVGCLIIEADEEAERNLDRQLKKYGIEKIVLG